MKNIKSYMDLVLEELNLEDQEELVLDLFTAVYDGEYDKVKSALNAGASPNAPEYAVLDDGWRPLHIASRDGYTYIVELLLDRGAEVDAKTGGDGITALSLAANNGHSNVVKILLDHGASINPVDRLGLKPIHRAGVPSVLKVLLDRGANVDEETVEEHPRTPLHFALQRKERPAAEFLVRHGADALKAFAGPQEIFDFFSGDIDWWPEGDLKRKLQLMKRSKKMFGM